MQFNTWIFVAVFLPIVILGYFAINKYKNEKCATLFLIVANLVFYGYANLLYLVYFVATCFVNFVIGKKIIENHKKSLMILGVSLNICALALLKYFNFFIETLNILMKSDYNLVNVFMPLGLSFFTFQFIAFLYDCYHGKVEKIVFWNFMAYATYFPKIIQGPIMLYQDFEKQYIQIQNKKFIEQNFAKGLYSFAMGLGKKILIADVLGNFVNPGFSTYYQEYNSTMTILLVLSYTLQIYFDFSAYSDMARGISFMLNIELPRNFDSPYQALSVNDFWKRWHMSLTTFLTKYLYVPLGGNRKGEFRTYVNVLIVFAVSGLWHGANYTFIVWGILHGIASVLEKKWKFSSKMNVVLQWAYTFSFVNVAWIFFRANSLTQALRIIKNIVKCDFSGILVTDLQELILPEIKAILGIFQQDILLSIYPLLFILFLLIWVLQFRNMDKQVSEFKPTISKVIMTVFVVTWCVLSFGTKITFIYEMF